MKKLLALSFSALLCLSFLTPQQTRAQANFGLRAGLNFANINDRPDGFEPDSRTGVMLGGYLNVKVPMSPISIQPEALYSQKGYESGGATLKLDYLEIPVLAKFSFAPGPVQPHVYFGPYAGFVLNSEVSGNGISVDVDNTQTDFGGVIGAGADLNAGITKLNVGLRYSFGLVDAIDGTQGKNSALSIVAGFDL